MHKFFKINMVAIGCLCASVAGAQEAHQLLRKADSAYESGNYSDAEVNYRRALEQENSTKGNYNLGNSTYRQERYDEAVKHFQSAAESAKDRQTKAQAFHNLGNAHFQNGKFKESVDAYKNALRLNPADFDTKRNLANALRRLPPETPEKQQGESQSQNDQQKQQEKDQNQPNQGQPDRQPPEEPQENENQEGGQPPQQPTGNGQQPQELSKEEARQLLEIMDQEEQKVQQKLRRAQSAKKKTDKDW